MYLEVLKLYRSTEISEVYLNSDFLFVIKNTVGLLVKIRPAVSASEAQTETQRALENVCPGVLDYY